MVLFKCPVQAVYPSLLYTALSVLSLLQCRVPSLIEFPCLLGRILTVFTIPFLLSCFPLYRINRCCLMYISLFYWTFSQYELCRFSISFYYNMTSLSIGVKEILLHTTLFREFSNFSLSMRLLHIFGFLPLWNVVPLYGNIVRFCK